MDWWKDLLNVFKRAIKKANGIEEENEELQEFLSNYQITPNPNTNVNMFPSRTDVCYENSINIR